MIKVFLLLITWQGGSHSYEREYEMESLDVCYESLEKGKFQTCAPNVEGCEFYVVATCIAKFGD